MQRLVSPERQWAKLAADGYFVVYRAVTRTQIKTAETKLGTKLPAAYVDLVTAVGAPAIGAQRDLNANDPDNLPFCVLTPDEVVRRTMNLRRAPDADEAMDDAELASARRNVKRAIMFQLGRDAGEGYVFLTDKHTRGEPWVADYAHDYLYELMWDAPSAVVWTSFARATAAIAARIRESPEDYKNGRKLPTKPRKKR